MVPLVHKIGWPVALLLLALLSCHDAPRNNPFDPALTPAVELQVALDDTVGTATLTWSRYEGRQPFREYRVLRNIADRKSVDTLAHLSAVAQTAFVDTTLAPNTVYVYRVETLNAGGYASSSEEKSIAGFSVGAVHLLGVENDQESGGLALRWSRYVGPDFASYQVHRRQVGTDKEELLAEIATSTDTTFSDQAAQAGVDYLYTLTVQAAGQELLSNAQAGRLVLPPVEVTRADFSSTTASASLAWTQYRGARFKSYKVLRQTAGLTSQVIAEKTAIADTSTVDPGLLGNTEYFYQVVVVTEREEEVPSAEKSGRFHALVATWPLGEDVQTRGRLYVEPGDRIVAAVYRGGNLRSNRGTPWILSFDPEGRLLEEWKVPGLAPLIAGDLKFLDGATSLSPEGRRFFGLSMSDMFGVLSFGPDGQSIVQERALFTDAFPNLSDKEKEVQGEISLKANNKIPGFIDNVRVSAGGRELFLEDFEEFPEGALDGQPSHNWEVKDGKAFISQGALQILGSAKMTSADETWQNIRLEADQANTVAKGESIQIGGDQFSRFILHLDATTQQVLLNWEFSPPGELGLEPQGDSLSLPILLMDGVFYGLSLEALGGVVNASVKDPVLWGDTSEAPVGYLWSSLALVGDILAFTWGDQIYLLTQEGKLVSQSQFAAQISEIRVWENPKDGAPWVGVCVPDLDQITMARVPASNPSSWPRRVSPDLGFAIGPGLGSSTDFLYYPTSFAVGPDGRLYVLDAGNARVVVFGADRQSLTQWGHRGSGEGEFDFGKRADHFAGSIAVDSEGYIYVLDVFNQRIQKFAP